MPEVENDTDDSVDYSYDEGQGTSGISLFKPLGPRQVKTLNVGNEHFNIYFYERGGKGEPLALEKGVPRDSFVRLYCPMGRRRLRIEVRPLVGVT